MITSLKGLVLLDDVHLNDKVLDEYKGIKTGAIFYQIPLTLGMKVRDNQYDDVLIYEHRAGKITQRCTHIKRNPETGETEPVIFVWIDRIDGNGKPAGGMRADGMNIFATLEEAKLAVEKYRQATIMISEAEIEKLKKQIDQLRTSEITYRIRTEEEQTREIEKAISSWSDQTTGDYIT